MRAVERLIAEKGIENVSIRDIVSVAGQKNESALQYHFKNLDGLINALHDARDTDIQIKRAALLASLRATTTNPTLREICKLMVEPVFLLAKAQSDFRRYVKAFGHEITLTERSAVAIVEQKGGQTNRQIGALLRTTLAHLDNDAYLRRMDGALRYISAAMFHQARQKNAFRGDQADLFFSHLIDALVGLLGANESVETRALADALKPSSREIRK